MVDQTMMSNGNVRLRIYPNNAFVNPQWPTVAELNAGLRLEDAVLWDGFDFGTQASETSSVPPLSAKSVVDVRSQSNYGGSLPIWYPGAYDDPTNQLSLIYDLVDEPRTVVYIAMSVDGEIGEPGQPDSDYAFADGDLVSIYRVQTDAWDDMTEGDDPFYYTLGFLMNGVMAHYTVASATAPTLTVVGDSEVGVGEYGIVEADVNGRNYTRGVRWTTSDPDVATVSSNGVVTGVSAGDATITATLPRATGSVSDDIQVTVS